MNIETCLSLIRSGVASWNSWRMLNKERRIILDGIDISGENLYGIEIEGYGEGIIGSGDVIVNEYGIDFSNCSMKNARFSKSSLFETNFTGTDLTNADFSQSSLVEVNFKGSILKSANFEYTYLSKNTFSDQDLSNISFARARSGGWNNFDNATLDSASFYRSTINLSELKNAHSYKGLVFSRAELLKIKKQAKKFKLLWPDSLIQNFTSQFALYDDSDIEYHSCFISYSSKDDQFAQKLYSDLQDHGVKCWFAPYSLKIGDKIRPKIYDAIKNHAKLLLILSNDSLLSDWVEAEVEAAFEQENLNDESLLFPVRIDSSIFNTESSWAATLRRQRHIGNFEQWENLADYTKNLERLLSDLIKGKNIT